MKTDAKNQVHVTFYGIENDIEKLKNSELVMVRAMLIKASAEPASGHDESASIAAFFAASSPET